MGLLDLILIFEPCLLRKEKWSTAGLSGAAGRSFITTGLRSDHAHLTSAGRRPQISSVVAFTRFILHSHHSTAPMLGPGPVADLR